MSWSILGQKRKSSSSSTTSTKVIVKGGNESASAPHLPASGANSEGSAYSVSPGFKGLSSASGNGRSKPNVPRLNSLTKNVTDTFSVQYPRILHSLGVDCFGERIALGGKHKLYVANLNQPKQLTYTLSIPNQQQLFSNVAWCPHPAFSSRVAALSNKDLFFCDVEDGCSLQTLPRYHKRLICDLSWNQQEPNILVTCSADNSLIIWDIRSAMNAKVNEVRSYAPGGTRVQWNRLNAFCFASGHEGGEVQVWDIRNLFAPRLNFVAHMGTVTSLDWSYSRGGTELTTASSSTRQVKVWDVEKVGGTCLGSLQVATAASHVVCTPFGDGIAVVTKKQEGIASDSAIDLYSIGNMSKKVCSLQGRKGAVKALEWRKCVREGGTEHQLVTLIDDHFLHFHSIDRQWRNAIEKKISFPLGNIVQKPSTPPGANPSPLTLKPTVSSLKVDSPALFPVGVKKPSLPPSVSREFSALRKQRRAGVEVEDMCTFRNFCVVLVDQPRHDPRKSPSRLRVRFDFDEAYPNCDIPTCTFLAVDQDLSDSPTPEDESASDGHPILHAQINDLCRQCMKEDELCLEKCVDLLLQPDPDDAELPLPGTVSRSITLPSGELSTILSGDSSTNYSSSDKHFIMSPGDNVLLRDRPPLNLQTNSNYSAKDMADCVEPCPRPCGATFSGAGRLIFFSNGSASNFLRCRTLADYLDSKSSREKDAEKSPVRHGLLPMTGTDDSDQDDEGFDKFETNDYFDTFDMALAPFEKPLYANREQYRNDNQSESARDSQIERLPIQEDTRTVYYFDLSNLLYLSKSLGHSYITNIENDMKLSAICLANCEAARQEGRLDLVQTWSLLALISDEAVFDLSIKDSNDWIRLGLSEFMRPWALHPFGRATVKKILNHYQRRRDLQSLAIISCVLAHPQRAAPSEKRGRRRPRAGTSATVASRQQTSRGARLEERLKSPVRKKEESQESTIPFFPVSSNWKQWGKVNVTKPMAAPSIGELIETEALESEEESEEEVEEELPEDTISLGLLDGNDDSVLDRWRFMYADILHRWGEFEKAVEMRQFVSYVNDSETSVASTVMCTQCTPTSSTPQDKFNQPCLAHPNFCSLCHLPVADMSSFCFLCGHGGHMEHMREWFQEYKTCATGCGCACLEALKDGILS